MTDNLSVKDWYNSIYHRNLHNSGNYQEAGAFISELIGHLKPPPGSMLLEVGCGDGQRSKHLSEMGFMVTGVDSAAANIAKALELSSDTLNFYEHDVRLPFWANYFDFIFNFFNHFGYYRTQREHEAAIRSIASALKPGGIFVIDYFNSHFVETNRLSSETKNIGSVSYGLRHWDDKTHFYTDVNVTDAALSAPVHFTGQFAKFSLEDFTGMFDKHGMQVEEVLGNYHLEPYDSASSPRLIVVARKKHLEPTDKEKRLYSDGRKTDALT